MPGEQSDFVSYSWNWDYCAIISITDTHTLTCPSGTLARRMGEGWGKGNLRAGGDRQTQSATRALHRRGFRELAGEITWPLASGRDFV